MIGANSIGASPIGADAGAVEIAPTTGTANLNGPIQTLVSSGSNFLRIYNAALVAPSPTLISLANLMALTELTAPAGLLTSFGGGAIALVGPSPELLSAGRDTAGENAATLSAPIATLSAFTGAVAQAAVPAGQLIATATVFAVGRAELSAPTPTMASNATTGTLVDASLTAPLATLVGYSGAVVNISLAGRHTVQASATVGSIGGAALTVPLFQLVASAKAEVYGGANLLAPSPRMGDRLQAWLVAPVGRLTAIGSATITATYEAYAVNLNHVSDGGGDKKETTIDEVTRYTNFPFTHVVRYQNSYYGANATGLYLLEGTTDDGSPIPWAVTTGMMDFGTPKLKTVAVAYFGGRFGRASTITLSAGEAVPVSYSFSTPRSALAKNHRQVFGRGVKARYHALSAVGEHEFELDDVTLDIHNTTRRV